MDQVAEFAYFLGDQFQRLHWGALAVTVAAALLWTRLVSSPQLSGIGFWLAIGGGAATGAISTLWVQPNVTQAVGDIAASSETIAPQGAHLVQIAVVALDLVLVLAVLVLVIVLAQVRLTPRPVRSVSQGFGIGYAGHFLQQRLPGDFAAGISFELIAPIAVGGMLVAIAMATAMLLGHARLTGGYPGRLLQAIAISLIGRYILYLEDPGWQAAGLGLLGLVALFYASATTQTRPRTRY